MSFILGFLAAILFLCLFSAMIHFFRWIEDTFYSTIISVNPVETNEYDPLSKAREKILRSKNQTPLKKLFEAFDSPEHDIEVHGKVPKQPHQDLTL